MSQTKDVQIQRSKVLGVVAHFSISRLFVLHFALALLSSLFVVYFAQLFLGKPKPLSYDGYFELATSLAEGHGYVFKPGGHPVFHRPPLYPALLVPGALLPGRLHRLYIAALNSTLLAGAGALLFWLAREMFGSRVAALSWLIFVSNPILLYVVKTAISCFCQTFIYMGIITLCWKLYSLAKDGIRPPFWFGPLLGVALSAGALCHGTMLAHAIFVLVAFGLWSFLRPSVHLVPVIFSAALILLLAITPWTWRNYRVTGKIIPVVGNSGFAYFAGNAHWGITKPARQPNETMEESEFRHIGLPPENASTLIEYRGFTEIAPEELTNKRAKEDLKAYPLRFGKKVTLNAFEYHFPLLYYLIPPSGTEPSTHRFVERMLTMQEKLLIPISLINVALVGAALCALYSLFRSNQRFPALFLASVWAAYACPYFPFLTAVNHNLYLFGVLPTLSILAAVFVLKPKMLAHSERVLAQDFSLDSK